MKKVVGFLCAAVLSTALFGQVLSSSGLKSTLSTSFGRSYGNVNDANRPNVHFYGVTETLQVRFDVGKFTVEGMLNWGAFNDWYNNGVFRFENTQRTPFWYTNHFNEGGWWTNGNTDSYYVNFLFHPLTGLDIGMGTRLNWKIGPAPSSLGNYWEPKAHIVQGGLKDAAPGHADVAGYTYYANKYSSNYKGDSYGNHNAALGIRYKYKDMFEIGVTLPSGVISNMPLFNAGFGIHPLDFLAAYITYDGILSDVGNLYTGLSLYFGNFILDGYIGIRFSPNDKNNVPTNKWGFGVSPTFKFPSIGLSIKPEAGFTFYGNPNYTFAWYAGGYVNMLFGKMFDLGTWVSWAGGASDKRWYDKNSGMYAPNNVGGFIFNIRPDFTWNITKRHSASVFFDYQSRTTYENKAYDVWAGGVYWTYKY